MGLKVQCSICNEIVDINIAKDDLDWQIEDTDEREMGIETHYSAVVQYECEKCKSEFLITLEIWEYPEGFFNDQDITIEGGELIDDADLDMYALSPLSGDEDYVEE